MSRVPGVRGSRLGVAGQRSVVRELHRLRRLLAAAQFGVSRLRQDGRAPLGRAPIGRAPSGLGQLSEVLQVSRMPIGRYGPMNQARRKLLCVPGSAY